MVAYKAPLADIDFALNHIADLTAISKVNGFQHADPDTVRGVLAEAARFFEEVIAPTNRTGDIQGSTLQEDGSVVTPDGFREAYAAFVEAGWSSVHIPEEHGGGGFPYTVGIVLQEMFKSSNLAFSLAPLLTQAAIEALSQHGSDEQQSQYLEKLVTGEWTGTMCLTEPHAGSDVGAITTRAVPQDDGTYRITGQKIFITWGEHDLTDNIVHLVLAKTPGAAPGTKGISLFIVPKHPVQSDGSLGEHNDFRIVSLEHKLGIKASPTCVVSFGDGGEGAIGYLVGEEQRGMKYMFTMMNSARIGVGVEGLAIGELAYQLARSYAEERPQGTAVGAEKGTTSPIIDHPDVRRMLLTMKAYNEAMRSILYTTAAQVDMERHSETDEQRARAEERVALFTPISKAWSTDRGVDVASLGIQVHGGMGYIEETGAAQLLRDIRISPIYEGTNGIQAIDLVMRKLPMRDGAVVGELIAEMRDGLSTLGDDMAAAARSVAEGIDALEQASGWLGSKLADGSYDDALAGATPYLEMFGTVLSGSYLLEGAAGAARMVESGEGDTAFLEARVAVAKFYCEQIVPGAAALLPAVTAGAQQLDVTAL